MFHVPEQYRYRQQGAGNCGVFKFSLDKNTLALCIASDGGGWEHVSISITSASNRGKVKPRTPTWAEMCRIKDLFWDEEDTVLQYHPAKSEYVNNHKFCLHLWRPVNVNFPRPPRSMVGI